MRYRYCIAETFPSTTGEGFKVLLSYDRRRDAQEVLDCLEAHNRDFTSYIIILKPIKEELVENPIEPKDQKIVEEKPVCALCGGTKLVRWDWLGAAGPCPDCNE